MPRTPIPLARNFGKGRSNAADMTYAANMYGEEVVGSGKTDWVLYPTPGAALFSTVGGTPRGQLRAAEVNYYVAGTTLYSVTSSGVTAAIGLIEGAARVDMFFNGAELTIVAELKSYRARRLRPMTSSSCVTRAAFAGAWSIRSA
jgi:hypothetical protein